MISFRFIISIFVTAFLLFSSPAFAIADIGSLYQSDTDTKETIGKGYKVAAAGIAFSGKASSNKTIGTDECRIIWWNFTSGNEVYTQISELKQTWKNISFVGWKNGKSRIIYRDKSSEKFTLRKPLKHLEAIGFGCGQDGYVKVMVTDCKTGTALHNVDITGTDASRKWLRAHPTEPNGTAILKSTSVLPKTLAIQFAKSGYITVSANINFSGRKIDQYAYCMRDTTSPPPTSPEVQGERNPANGHIYRLGDGRKTWSEARNYCQQKGGHLATITSRQENDFVASKFDGDKRIWLGGSDAGQEGNWRWVTGEPWIFNNWDSSEPSNSGRGEDYLELGYGGLWNDDGLPKQDRKFYFLCEWSDLTQGEDVQPAPPPASPPSLPPASSDSTKHLPKGVNLSSAANGHRYRMSHTRKTWSEARKHCRQEGGYLATVTSRSENDFITRIYDGGENIWLGGSDAGQEGNWSWVTGEPWTVSNWHSGQPDDWGKGQDYLRIWNDGKWDDAGLPKQDTKSYFLCEWGDLTQGGGGVTPDKMSASSQRTRSAPPAPRTNTKSAYNYFESFQVPAKGQRVKSRTILRKGVSYKIVVTGTFQYDEGEAGTRADAQHEQNDDLKFVRMNSLAINGSMRGADKSDLSTHSYEYEISGNGKPLVLHIDDSNYDDNAGYLTAALYGPSPRANSLPAKKRVASRPPPVHECDRLAADPRDSRKVAEGVRGKKMRASEAITACRKALKTYPDTARFHYLLGQALHQEKRFADALKAYKAAANVEYPAALVSIGFMHYKGQGIAKNKAEAFKWIRRAAKTGFSPAMRSLGRMYEKGIGVAKNKAEANKWYSKAATNDNPKTKKKVTSQNTKCYPCDYFSGVWGWSTGSDFKFLRSGVVETGSENAKWICDYDTVVITWNDGHKDILKLTPDGQNMSGHNQQNGADLSGYRKSPANSCAKAVKPQPRPKPVPTRIQKLRAAGMVPDKPKPFRPTMTAPPRLAKTGFAGNWIGKDGETIRFGSLSVTTRSAGREKVENAYECRLDNSFRFNRLHLTGHEILKRFSRYRKLGSLISRHGRERSYELIDMYCYIPNLFLITTPERMARYRWEDGGEIVVKYFTRKGVRLQKSQKTQRLRSPAGGRTYSPPPVHDCDRLAANPRDPRKVAQGVENQKIHVGEAVSACRKALESHPGTPRFHYQLGRALRARTHFAESLIAFRAAGDAGYVMAFLDIGMMYTQGEGVTKNWVEALKWFYKATRKGNLIGMYLLAAAYDQGPGRVTKDKAAALKWFRHAADKGFAPAMKVLGIKYETGQGVPRDEAKAYEWYRKAAKNGDPESKKKIIIMDKARRGAVRNLPRQGVKPSKPAKIKGKRNPANGHVYRLGKTRMTWSKANRQCLLKGGYLATITSRQENNFVSRNFDGSKRIWLGGSDGGGESVWRWMTGEPWSFSNWDKNEPNDSGKGEDFLELGSGGRWNDDGLPKQDRKFYFLCEWGNTSR